LLSLLILSSFGNLICPVKVRRLPQLFNGFSWLRRCSSTWGFQLPTNHYLHDTSRTQRTTKHTRSLTVASTDEERSTTSKD
jgi:hypothetical protein